MNNQPIIINNYYNITNNYNVVENKKIGYIYSISNDFNKWQYIGSTSKNIYERFYEHSTKYRDYCKEDRKYRISNSLYKYLKNNKIEFNELKIKKIYELEYSEKMTLRVMEGIFIKLLENSINEQNEGVFWDDKEYVKNYNKNYRLKNNDAIKEYNKKYRMENKDAIKLYSGKVFKCNCGKELTVAKKSRHEKTLFHLNYIYSS